MRKAIFFTNRMHLISTAALIISAASCQYGINELFYRNDSVTNRSAEITEITAAVPQDEKHRAEKLLQNISTASAKTGTYQFIVLSDIHYGGKYAVNEKILTDYLDSLESENRPLFGVVLGDVSETGRQKEYQCYSKFTKCLLDNYGIPIFTILGNHDLYNSGSALFEKMIYPYCSFYRMQTNNYSYYFLDSANGTLGEKQMASLTRTMEQDTKKKFVFMHYPLYGSDIFYFCMANPQERARLIHLLAKNNTQYLFCGHYHEGRQYDFGSFREIGVRSYSKYSKWIIVSVNENSGEITLK